MERELYKKLCRIVKGLYEKTNLKRIRFTDADVILISIIPQQFTQPRYQTSSSSYDTGQYLIS